MVKEFLLITMLTDPMVYTEKSACEEAAKKLMAVDETAICIPAGKPQNNTMAVSYTHLTLPTKA